MGAFETAVLGGITGGIGNAIGGLFGGGNDVQSMSTEDKQWQLDMVRLGNQMDLKNQNLAYDHRLTRMKEHGLTSVEMFGSPGSSPGGGTTGSGATLGNMANQQSMQTRQLQQQQNMAARQQAAQSATALAQTKMQTDAQRDVAEINAGVTERGQDIQAMIANNRLELDKRQLEEIAIPDLQNKTNLNAEQIKVAINEAANTDPEWVRKKTVMQLGVDNGIQNLILGRLNLDLTNPDQIAKLTDAEYSDALTALLSASSATGKNTAAVENIMDRIFDTVKAEEKRRAMERGSKMLGSPNPQGGFQARQLGNSGPVPAGTKKYKHFNRDFPGRG